MPNTKNHNRPRRQMEAADRQFEYDQLTPEEKKAKSDAWKKRN